MRNILIASAAAIAFGATMTPVMAGPFWFLGKTIDTCVDAAHFSDTLVAGCAYNKVDSGMWGSDDHNTQKIKQTFSYKGIDVDEDDLDQRSLAIGVNTVHDGDHNYQSVTQSASVTENGDHGYADVYNDGMVTLTVGVNSVENGDGNSQSIEQSATVDISYED